MLFHTLGLRAHLAATGAPARPSPSSCSSRARRSPAPRTSRALLARAGRPAAPATSIVITDTSMWSGDVPTICTGMRGLSRRPGRRCPGRTGDLHSGSFGGACRNPLHASWPPCWPACTTSEERVTLPGFYDGVLPLTDARAGAHRPAAVRRGSWLRQGAAARRRTASRASARWSGSGPGRPPRSTASGAATPAGQQDDRPAEGARQGVLPAGRRPGPGRWSATFEAWLRSVVPDGIGRDALGGPGVRPCLTPIDHPACGAVTPRDAAGVRHARCSSPGRAAAARRPTCRRSWRAAGVRRGRPPRRRMPRAQREGRDLPAPARAPRRRRTCGTS